MRSRKIHPNGWADPGLYPSVSTADFSMDQVDKQEKNPVGLPGHTIFG
jgi:hypothetical protein